MANDTSNAIATVMTLFFLCLEFVFEDQIISAFAGTVSGALAGLLFGIIAVGTFIAFIANLFGAVGINVRG
jgi:hypothetical protein